MEKLSEVSVAILAGGFGTRLRSVVNDRPKVLAEINRKPFLAYLLDYLLEYGVASVVLCTGYKGEQVKTEFGEAYGGLRLIYSYERAPLGTAGALSFALPFFSSKSVLILNGDSFCDANLAAFWEWHHESNADVTMLITKMPDTGQYGRVHVDADGRLIRFEEKGYDTGPGWINAGIYLVRRRLLEMVPTDRTVSLEREMFPVWVKLGLYSFRAPGPFIDIGTPESYALAERFFDPRAQI